MQAQIEKILPGDVPGNELDDREVRAIGLSNVPYNYRSFLMNLQDIALGPRFEDISSK